MRFELGTLMNLDSMMKCSEITMIMLLFLVKFVYELFYLMPSNITWSLVRKEFLVSELRKTQWMNQSHLKESMWAHSESKGPNLEIENQYNRSVRNVSSVSENSIMMRSLNIIKAALYTTLVRKLKLDPKLLLYRLSLLVARSVERR